jgi:hypothetical protein
MTLRTVGQTISAIGQDVGFESTLSIGFPSPMLAPDTDAADLFDSNRLDLNPENNTLVSQDVLDRRTRSSRSNCPLPELVGGTMLEPYLDDVREFRDDVLLATRPGREFVDWYYAISPKATAWLQGNEWSAPIVRAGLTPVVLMIAFPLTSLQLLLGILGFRYRRSIVKLVKTSATAAQKSL